MTNKELRQALKKRALSLVLPVLAGCQGVTIDRLAADPAFVAGRVEPGELPQRYLRRADRDPGEILRVYFGGDGRPWLDRRPNADPTGRRQLGLRLFLADPAADAYLGRPCYQGGADAPGCDSSLWTSARYGPVVVKAMVAGLAALRASSGARRVELVGYSGGGTLALLVAARDPAVVRVMTVAPLLDPAAWTAHHRLATLEGSLSPLDEAEPVRYAEGHLLGGRDRVVPPRLARRYAAHRPAARFRVVDRFDHRCCWLAHWPGLLDEVMRAD